MLGPRRTPGERIDAFEIVRHLASGGMGDVYVARHTETDELVALKLLGEPSAAAAVRFQREARLVAKLVHPHIVGGRGSGQTREGQAYIAMELLTGTDLDTRM